MIHNTGYFLKETKTIILLNKFSNAVSLCSTGLILFILAMVISGWWVSSRVVSAIQGEAEINAYYNEGKGNPAAPQLAEKIKNIQGVREVKLVDAAEAYERMVKILGQDAKVLELFDANPFSSFIEIKIHLEAVDTVLKKVGQIPGITHVRNNREVLDRLRHINEILQFLGMLAVTAVGITTLVIISHLIRLGIYNNREQINTLRLLGAPETFIALPFILEGLLLTLGGGILAAVLAAWVIKQVYLQMTGPLPFIPLPPRDALVTGLVILLISLSGILGVAGSLFGLASAKDH